MKKFIIILLAAILFVSCKEVQYITVPEVHTEYKTITVHDSVDRWRTHYEFVKGDTIHCIDTIYSAIYRSVHDTTAVHDTTTIVVPDTAELLREQMKHDEEMDSMRRQRNIFIIISLIAIATILLAVYVYGKKRKS